MILESVLIGIGSGIAYGITGYLKSLKKNGEYEEFDAYKFGQSVIVGGVAGALMGYYGWTFEVATQFLVNTGLVTFIEHVKKGIIRYLKYRL